MSNTVSRPIAYLTATFPALSHTFILREIQGIERCGLEVLPVSIRMPSGKDVLGPDERAMKARTKYILASARQPLVLVKALGWALCRPAKLAAALGLAIATRPAGLRALIYQIIYLIEAIVLARFVTHQNCGHIHNHFANSSGTVAMIAARLSGVTFSFTLHGPSDLFDARHWRLDRKIAEASFVACISHFARSQAMLNSDQKHWPKLRIVHCGVMPEFYGRNVTESAPKTVRAIFVGRLAAVKGLPVLFDALAMAHKTNPDIELTIVGDGPDRTALERDAQAFGNSVRFTGPLSQADVARELSATDMMILPSFAEGVPVVLMEALASGIPAIATRVAGVPELVKHGENGLIVAPGDAEGLTEAILTLAGDDSMRRAMGDAGRETVREHFNINRESAWLAKIFLGEDGAQIRPDTGIPPHEPAGPAVSD